MTEGTTPRPWYWEPGGTVLKTRVGSEGHRRGVGDYAFITISADVGEDQGDERADAELIVTAVNAYDRLKEIEAHAVKLVEWIDGGGQPALWPSSSRLNDLREVLENK